MSAAVTQSSTNQVLRAGVSSERRTSPKSATLTRSSPNQAEKGKSTGSIRNSSPKAVVSSATDNISKTRERLVSDPKRSPISTRHVPPKIVVKKEHSTSPDGPPTSRHRPRKLDLTSSVSRFQPSASSKLSGPHTAREPGGLAMLDVGLACLSPGFQTHDPTMQQQLQRSISVRDQQRHIIESRLQKTAKVSDVDSRPNLEPGSGSIAKTPSTSAKKRPPTGLSIVPPSHEQFANERVIQSAPLHQSFTGRQSNHPITRHMANQPSNLSSTSHIHQIPHGSQSSNRLPPIHDVFAAESLGIPRREGQFIANSTSSSSHSNQRPTFPSPGHPPPSSHPQGPGRGREYQSAEEAVAELAQGREDLLPKIVHYNSTHPPTPPSPSTIVGKHHAANHVNGDALRSSRRRPRAEYERDLGTPPLGSGPEARERRGPFGFGIDSPETQRHKKDEFLGLCSRAWDLFHS